MVSHGSVISGSGTSNQRESRASHPADAAVAGTTLALLPRMARRPGLGIGNALEQSSTPTGTPRAIAPNANVKRRRRPLASLVHQSWTSLSSPVGTFLSEHRACQWLAFDTPVSPDGLTYRLVLACRCGETFEATIGSIACDMSETWSLLRRYA
jgi:hypothetical protein